MNDRAAAILDNYEMQILRTWKGRGAILCETDQGIRILKEYRGGAERLERLNRLLNQIKENGFSYVEEIIPNKEGDLFCIDADRVMYIVKSYYDARECNIRDEEECINAVVQLAKLHKAMVLPELVKELNIMELPVLREFEKRNRELHKIRRFLKQKSQKTDFEIFLTKQYDYFYDRAVDTQENLEKEDTKEWLAQILKEGTFCHGDFQYHNILVTDNRYQLINFEKYSSDNPIKDLYLFMRKLLEKNNWDMKLGNDLLEAYGKERELSQEDICELGYRFCYPEKFWKIANFYYNSPKSWISYKNREKLEKLLLQEEAKELFIERILKQ